MLYFQVLGNVEKRHLINGGLKLNLEDGSVFSCIKQSIEMLREQALHNEIRLEFEYPLNNDLVLIFDSVKL